MFLLTLYLQVGVVAFSSDAVTPVGSTAASACYSDMLSQATPQNKRFLNSYINTLSDGGGTIYSKAFRAAFRFFSTSQILPKYDSRWRGKDAAARLCSADTN